MADEATLRIFRGDSQGGQMVEDGLQLHGWSKKRRVVIVRQRIRGGIAR